MLFIICYVLVLIKSYLFLKQNNKNKINYMSLFKKKKSFISRSDSRFLDRIRNGLTIYNTIPLVLKGVIMGVFIVISIFCLAKFNISIGFWGWFCYCLSIFGLVSYFAWRG